MDRDVEQDHAAACEQADAARDQQQHSLRLVSIALQFGPRPFDPNAGPYRPWRGRLSAAAVVADEKSARGKACSPPLSWLVLAPRCQGDL